MTKNVIVIPIYQLEFKNFEITSLLQGFKILNKHTIVFITYPNYPTILIEKMIGTIPYRIEYFNNKYFKSVDGYNELLTSLDFYQRFSQFEYMLIYQTDAYDFKDELDYWCSLNYDYIGAPWFKGFKNASNNDLFIGVGNGGFSLRKIDTFINFLRTYRVTIYQALLINFNKKITFLKKIHALLSYIKNRNNNISITKKLDCNEDEFFCVHSEFLTKKFRIPEPLFALKFSFEVLPERLYDLNDCKLPFGCHAWNLYYDTFWKKHIPIIY